MPTTKALFCLLQIIAFYSRVGNQSTVVAWGLWSEWPVSCSVSCGIGQRCRERKCLDGFGKIHKPSLCAGPEKSSETECSTCVISSRCPQKPGWSEWSEWSACQLIRDQASKKADKRGCRPGNRVRKRLCNNPPPEPGENSITCTGEPQQVRKCPYGCPDIPVLEDYNINARVGHQVEQDHLMRRISLRDIGPVEDVVKIRAIGESVIFNCDTPAYRLARELADARVLSAVQAGLPSRQLRVSWRLGGRPITEGAPELHQPISQRQRQLQKEETLWLSKLKRGEVEIREAQLIMPNVKPGDAGLVTCHLSIGQAQWTAIFFTLIILDQRFSAPALMPFYLHSGVGSQSALTVSNLHWYDAARLVWKQNGEVQFTDLLARAGGRIRRIAHLNNTHQGQWDCFLVIPLPDAPTVQASPENFTVSAVYWVNSFFLRVAPEPLTVWELGDSPPAIARMRLISLITFTICLALTGAVAMTVWAVWRWVSRSPKVEQLQCCVEEELEDRTRLVLTAQHRAHTNRELLVPLIEREEEALVTMRTENQITEERPAIDDDDDDL
ncbi:unnamed protein product [Schistocephalus solidus]|uniref:Ig-like domain-containing protein n=1 Tax=Schistocephalus solidus TaxID=70667 RepID=A0A183T0R0_SCHSO|nr:unnamed protein product [Schistocephalus solidus]